MALDWYYADARNQQQGPVAAATLAGYYRDGAVHAATLVWREGLAGWVPLRDVAAQLGLIVVNAPAVAARPSGPPAGFVQPKSGASTAVIVIVVLLLVAIPVLGILAAIAIPAYQDYTIRAKVMQGVMVADGLKPAVVEYRSEHERCPRNGDDGFGAAESYATAFVSEVHVGKLEKKRDCGIELKFAKTGTSLLDGKRLTFELDEQGQWWVSSDLAGRYLPTSLRNRVR